MYSHVYSVLIYSTSKPIVLGFQSTLCARLDIFKYYKNPLEGFEYVWVVFLFGEHLVYYLDAGLSCLSDALICIRHLWGGGGEPYT